MQYPRVPDPPCICPSSERQAARPRSLRTGISSAGVRTWVAVMLRSTRSPAWMWERADSAREKINTALCDQRASLPTTRSCKVLPESGELCAHRVDEDVVDDV